MSSWARVLELLDSYGVEPDERERERVQLDILKLSGGSEEKVREYVAVAKRDYRDVLFWAEYPEESRLDTPEKRQRVRKMFEKFGIDPRAIFDLRIARNQSAAAACASVAAENSLDRQHKLQRSQSIAPRMITRAMLK